MRPTVISSSRAARSRLSVLALAGLLPFASACDSDDDPVIVQPGDLDPEITAIHTVWVEEGWVDLDPVGSLGVQLFWELPDGWDGEVFRVYSRESGGGDYFLIATVTACTDRRCTYTDTNVRAGSSYDYFVVTVDERSDREVGESAVESVDVSSEAAPAAPTGLRATALDNAIFLQWESVEAEKYRIFLEGVDQEALFFEVGATDGTGYVDTRAENGKIHTYRIAAVAQSGRVGSRSQAVSGIPRPDYHAELIYPTSENAGSSGFHFRASEGENPIVAGGSDEAQWRLEASGGDLQIVPIGDTRVTEGVFTTSLSCGPGSEADCEHVAEAPAAEEFGDTPVTVFAGNTYVFSVSDGGETHFGKIRVQGVAKDDEGRTVLVFDWAYQTRPDEPSLNLSPVR